MARPKLFLSSYLFSDEAEALRWDDPSRRGRAAIVLNALDVFGETRTRNWDREVGGLDALGYDSYELDLRPYAVQPGLRRDLAEYVADLDLLWIVGGNAFWLARVMHASGFGSLIAPPLRRGTLTYAGYSAAACVAGPDLRGIDLMDEPERVPEGHHADWPAVTLGLIPYRIVPHWQSDHPEAADAERARQRLVEHGLAHRCVRDGEAILFDTLPNDAQ